MAARHIPWITPGEYLDQEAVSKSKHTYHAGLVTAMVGGSFAHWILAGNLITALNIGLRGSGCRAGGSDLLFRTGSGQMFTYPDVMVVCGPMETVPGRKHVLTNPVFVAEVMSPTTEAMDRGAKSAEYRATASLREYALISQDQPWVQIHTRDETGSWQITEVTGLDGECAFTGINCVVPVAALYEGALDD